MVHKPILIFSWLPAVIMLAALSCGSLETKQQSMKATQAGMESSIQTAIKREKGLAHHATGFLVCHSRPDFNRLSGPIFPGRERSGGRFCYPGHDAPVQFFNRAIKSAILIDWNNEELTMALKGGISKKRDTNFTQMPNAAYAQMAATDVQDIIRFFRHLAPIEHLFPPPILFI